MTAFLVASVAGDDLKELVGSAFTPDERFEISRSMWLVSRSGLRSSFEVWTALAQTDPDTPPDRRPRIIIVPMVGYYGRANASVWQWLEVKDTEDG